jgi:hypothetical protein
MTTTGVRPKGSTGPMYHPERDLAYITPTLMAQAMSTLVIEKMRPELQEFAADHNVTQEDLNRAVVAFAEAQQLYVSLANPIDSAHQALEAKMFFHETLATRLLITAAIGEAITGAWFVSVRDVTRVDQDSPAITQMAEMLEAARTVAGVNLVWAPDALSAKLTKLEQKVENRDAWLRDAAREARRIHGQLERELAVYRHVAHVWNSRGWRQRWHDWACGTDFDDYLENARDAQAKS